uniref:Myosin-9-like n=1 Tax=Saccoglossus kowalevskii TaxID=10224 RepID=A0ABM0M3D9_SACKO|nr:PREDICTED: myosin-9-like [Saccoglossus kowalevskii]
MDVSLRIRDNLESLLSGQKKLVDISCNVPLSYGLYLNLHDDLQKMGINIQQTMPDIIRLFDPDIVLPVKISNLTKRVRRNVEKARKDGKEVQVLSTVIATQSAKCLSAVFAEKSVTPQVLISCSFTASQDNSIKLEIKNVLELRNFLIRNNLPWANALNWLNVFMRPSAETKLNVTGIRRQWTRLHDAYLKLKCSKHQHELDDFLSKSYKAPRTNPNEVSETVSETSRSNQDLENILESLSRNLADSYQEISEITQSMEELSREKLAALDKISEMSKKQDKYRQKLIQINDLKAKLAALTPRNFNKKIKRRDEKIKKMTHQIEEQNKVMKEYIHDINQSTRDNEILQEKLDQILMEKKNLQKSKSYWKTKAQSASEHHSQKVKSNLEHVKHLENDNMKLREKIEDLMDANEIKTFENGKYTDSIRQVYYDLLTHNVSVQNCTAVVKSVLKNILNVDVDRLPNRSSLSLGFQELLSGSADDYMNATIETFEELAQSIAVNDEEKKNIYAQLILRSKNIMSDRHVVNKKYKSKMEVMRESLLPIVEQNWDSFDENEKTKMKTVNHLLCGMHVLVNMAAAASSACIEFEKEKQDQINTEKLAWYKSNQSFCFNLLYQASKGFTDEGCQKSGVYTDFGPYLEDELKEKNRLIKFEHNRFNVAFYQGAALYYHKQHISDFLSSGRCNSTNKLISQVQTVLDEQVIIAECRALGIISKLVTGPLMRLLEKDMNYYDMNIHWLELKTCLADNAIDATPLLKETKYITNSLINKDESMLHYSKNVVQN